MVVIAERIERDERDDARVRRCWHRSSNWIDEIDSAACAVRADVVHVQHDESMFGIDGRFVELMSRLRKRRIPCVVTLHTVYANRRGRSFHPQLGETCGRIIAHQTHGMANVLAEQGVDRGKIEVIAHGTPMMKRLDRTSARQTLHLPAEDPLALFFGFIHFRKRIHCALEGFELAAKQLPNAKLVIAGRIRRLHLLDEIYRRWLERKLRAGIESGRVIYRPWFVPVEAKATYYSAADVIVLPHFQSYGSASGVLHEALGARKPVLCTNGNKFAEATSSFSRELPESFPAPHDVRGWQRAFETMLGSTERRQRASELAATLADQTSWSRSATSHAAVYREVAST